LTVAVAAFVPGYSGGTATDLHRFPYSPRDDFSLGTRIEDDSTQTVQCCQIISSKILLSSKYHREKQGGPESYSHSIVLGGFELTS